MLKTARINLGAYATADLQAAKALLVDGGRADLSTFELVELIDDRLKGLVPFTIKKAAGPAVCPSCGRGLVFTSGQQDIRYRICVDRKTGQAGCGWSEVI